MKLLMATHYFESHRGGIEIVAGRLARELERRGVAVIWLATDATAPPPANSGCGISRPIPAWNFTERRLGFPLPLPGPAAAAAIWREVKTADAVLLHDCLYPTNVLAMLAARWHGKPVVVTQHIATVPYSNPLLRGLMTAANALITHPMLAAASQVVFISEIAAHHFADVSFRNAPVMIFNGVDTDTFHPPAASFDKAGARAALGLPAEGPVAVFVGRFVEKKGLHIIERLARRSSKMTFALAGWGPIDPAAWCLPNVHVFSGLKGASLVPLYHAGDVFVLPSTGEGLPLVLQEVLACGLPVVCGAETAVADPAASDLIEGIAIDARNHDATATAFASGVERALAWRSTRPLDPEVRFRYAKSRYSWPQTASAYLDIFAGLTMSPTAAAPQRPPTTTTAEQQRRLWPRMWDTDWLVLRGMHATIDALAARIARRGLIALDFGCGEKPYESLFTSRGVTYRGADLNAQYEVRIGADGALVASDNSADLVVSFQVLEHVRDIDTYFSEARRVLRDNGLLLLSTHGTWLYHPHPEDHRRWTREGLVNDIQARGFEVIDCIPVVGPLAWTTMVRLTCASYALRGVPVGGKPIAGLLAIIMNAKAWVEDRVTPAWVTKDNACVYVTLSRPKCKETR